MLLSLHLVVAQTRTATASGNWNSTATWGGQSVPTSANAVVINNGVVVTVTANAAAASIDFAVGTNTNTGITVSNGQTLSVTGAITLRSANNNPVTRFISGAGTVNAGSLSIGNNTQPNNTNATRIHRLNLSVGTFNVGNVLVISRIGTQTSRVGNGFLSIESGTVNVSGTITTQNANAINVSTVALGTGSPTLNLTTTETPITTTGAGTHTYTFNTTGATVRYTRSGNQNIYGTNYHHLSLLNGSTKTFSANTATIGGNLLFDGVTSTLLRSLTIGGNVTFEGAYNVTLGAFTHNVGGNWSKNGWGAHTVTGSTINFTGASSELNGVHWQHNYNNISVSKTAGQTLGVNLGSELVIAGNFTLASGNYNQGTTNSVITGNWINNGGTVVSSAGIIRMNGSGTTIGGTASTTFSNLTINNNAGGISLGNSITVNGSLLLSNGLLRLGNFNLTLGANATNYTENYWAANMIITNGTGELRKLMAANGSYKFHLGDDTGTLEYTPATITFNSGTYAPGAYVSLRVVDAKHPNNSSPTHFLSRYWVVGQSGISNYNYNFVANYNHGGDMNGQAANQFAGIYTGSWANIGAVADGLVTANNVTTVGAITGLSQVTLNVTPTSLTGFNYAYGTGPSAAQSFVASGMNLTQNVTVTAPANYEISTSLSSGYASSLNLSVFGGTLSNTTVYVRLKAGLNPGFYLNEPVGLASSGSTQTVFVSGSVTAPTITTGAIVGSPFNPGASVSVPYTVTGIFNSGNVFTAQLSDATGSFSTAVNIGTLTATANGTISGTIPSNTPQGSGYRIRVVASNPSIVGSANTVDLAVNGIPNIILTPSELSGLDYQLGFGPSDAQTLIVSGEFLTSSVTITAPASFEVSLNNSTYSQSVGITAPGGELGLTTVYVRLKTGLASNNYTEQLTATATGATTRTMQLIGDVSPYCIAWGDVDYDTGIRLVNFNTINNLTPEIKTDGYSNFTSISTTVVKGNAYNLTVNLNTDGNYDVFARAWIDWNGNGSFDDAGEMYNLGTTTNQVNGATSLSPLSITVPENAVPGTTRMRVIAQWSQYPATACVTDFDGEVEDYSVIIAERSIATGVIVGSPFTSGAAVNVPFTITGAFVSGNVFTAQLSDATGSFASPTNIGTLPATTAGTIGATIPFNTPTGSGYRIRVVASNPNIIGSDNGVNLTVNYVSNTPVVVEATMGTPTAIYSNLKLAFDKINDGTHRGVIDVKIFENITETTSAILNASGNGSANYTSIAIYPAVAGVTVSANLNSAMIQLNGADNVTIDGRVNQAGSRDLTIINSNTGATARTVELLNSAQNNTINYVNIKGAGTGAAQGTINISTSASGAGNTNNSIAFNNISGVNATTRAANSIYSAGTATRENTGITIRDNDFQDVLSRSQTSNGILIAANSSDFTINNNRFFETASLVPTASFEYAAIRVNNASANNLVITNNTIGGNGSTGDWVKTNAFNNIFHAIVLNAGTTNNSVQGNVVRNFDYGNSTNASWYGIRILGGSANVSGNTIGSATDAASVKLNNLASVGTLYGIAIESGANNAVSNNTIAGLQTNAASTIAVNITGIFKNASAGELTIANNTIGSTTVANSIHATSAATGTAQLVYGIHNLGTGTVNINNNTVSNLNNATTSNTTAARMRGIFSEAGLNTITFNRVSNLNMDGLSNGANYPGAAIVGISLINKTAGLAHTIADNTVNNLSTNNTGKIEMYGIFYDGADATESLIARNFVHTFIVPNSGGSTGSYLHGISIFDGNYLAVNNIVYLGSNITIGCSIWGIWTNTNDNARIYHNTVYLTGTALSGTSNSYAFRSLNCPASLDMRNNILWDGRVNSSGTISHFALYLNCLTNANVNYNNYQFAQQFGQVGGTTYATLATWRTGTGLDANSLNVDPQLVNLGGTLPVNYQTNIQLQGTPIAAVTTDFNGVARVTPTMGAWEFFANPVEIWNGTTFRQSYPTLKAAFDAVNAGTYTGDMIIKFRGNTTETASAVLNASGVGASSYSRILIYPARTGVTVTGNLAAPLVSLNGARNVTFDGRVNGVSDPYQFTFINNNTSSTAETSTFRFVNSAQNDTIRYVNIQGASTATAGGNVYFAGATAGTGNSNNVITLNRITGLSASNRPVNAIYSQGNNARVNTGNIIHNNEIFDTFNPAITSHAIHVGAISSAFSITNNSIYSTSSLSPSAATSYYGIRINNTSGNAFVVSNNHIGGSAALSAGNFTKTASNNNPFFAIDLNVGPTASSVQGNIIRNITYSNNGNANFSAVNVGAGEVNVGTSVGNIIGAAVGNGSITFSNATTGGEFFGISVSGAEAVNVQNNTIASINVGNAAANATNFRAIFKSATAGNFTASRNIIGSLSTANSIQTTSASTGNAQTLYGIYSEGTGAIVVEENQIENLTNATTNVTTGTLGRVNGIWINAGSSNAINSNTVRNLTIANLNTATDFNASAVGINLTGTMSNRTVNDNRISFVSNTNASYAGLVFGLYFRSATTGTNTVNRNFIHNITSTSASATVVGVVKSTSAATFANNIISLGANATAQTLYGFYDVGGASNTTNLYFNTIYISGSGGAVSSMALLVNSADNTRNFRNNIFHNARSRTGGSGSHYAIFYNAAGNSNLTTNYNNYLATGTNGVLAAYGGSNRATLADLRTATGGDVNSMSTLPQYANANPTTDPAHYKPTVTLTGIAGTGVVTDFGLFSRPATAPTIGTWELTVNKWKGTLSTDWNNAANWTGNTVPPVDATIEFDAVPLRHCIMDQNRFVNNIINAQGTYRVVTNGFRLRIKGELQFTNGAQIDATSVNSTVEFAGATQQQIPAGAFFNNNVYNIDVNNPNNVVLNGTLRLLNNIVATQGRFNGSSNPTNFVYAGAALQTINSNIFFDNRLHNLTIDNVVGVEHNTDLTLNNNLTINAGRKLTILPSRLLYVSGNVVNNAGVNGLTIKSSASQPNGSLIFFNAQSNPVQATVEMYSKASWNLNNASGNRYNWQFMGIPVRNLVAVPTFTGAYVRRKIEHGTTISNHWVPLEDNSVMSPFVGYELVQPAPKTYSIQGELVNQSFNSGPLAVTPTALYPGQHLFSNPYTAAIDARQIVFGSSMEKTVWMYNTGTFAAWDASENRKVGENPGQHTAIPQDLAGFGGIPVQIPSMGAILVRATAANANAFVNFPYAAVSMKNTDRQRAKAADVAAGRSLENEGIAMSIVHLEGATSSDKLWLFTGDQFTADFDNGSDGRKMSGGVLNAELFAIEKGVHYQINASPELHNKSIGFRVGQDERYTLRFEHQNVDSRYSKIYLHDLLTNVIVDITESESTYAFTAVNHSNSVERFRILTRKNNDSADQKFTVFAGSNQIYVESATLSNAQIMVYDVTGRLFARQNMNGTLHSVTVPAHGSYVVKVVEGVDTHTQKVIVQ